MEQIEFFGHFFTKDGLNSSPDKVRAVKECGVPENKEAVRGFLGMAGYLDNFIQNYAAIAAPLYQLTRKETKFHWGKQEEEAFRKIQDTISSEKTMAFFDPRKPIILRTDVMDEYQFKALKHRLQEIKELEPSRDTLKTLQSDLTVKGEFTTTLRNKNRGTQKSKFLVIQGKMDSPPLLSKSTLLELGELKIDPEGTLKETNELRINTVKMSDDSIETVLREYSDVFQGIGCFRETNTGKKIEVNLEIGN